MTKMAAIPICGKTLKIFCPLTSGPLLTKLVMKHQRLKPIIFYSHHNPELTLTYLTARLNFETLAYIWEDVTTMDSLETIESFDLEIG